MTKKHSYRYPPCPAYDVEGMENWLSEQAKKGWFLQKDGFFAGIGHFEKGEPRFARYRLEAVQKDTSLWADNGGEPEDEELELNKAYTWEYLGKRGDFYIYRSFDPAGRELHTDPAIQALTLEAVKKRRKTSFFTLLFWLLCYSLFFLRGGLLHTLLSLGTGFFLLISLFVLWLGIDEGKELIFLQKLQKDLRENGTVHRGKDWKRKKIPYFVCKAAQFLLALTLVIIALGKWNDSMLEKDRRPLENVSVPFASMQDLTKEKTINYHQTMSGMSFNTVKEWSDLFALRCIDYSEQAALTLKSGKTLMGGYQVDYYETKNPFLARQLFREIYQKDSKNKHFSQLELPNIEGKYENISFYSSMLPIVLIQKENLVLRATFYQTSNYTLSNEEWISALIQSLEK